MMFLFIHLNLFISILSRNIPLPKPGNRPTLAIRRSSWCAAFGSPRAIPCCTSRTETLKFGDLRSKTPTGWWFGTFFIFPYDLGKSSSQLTESYFSEELKPPTSRMVQAQYVYIQTHTYPSGIWGFLKKNTPPNDPLIAGIFYLKPSSYGGTPFMYPSHIYIYEYIYIFIYVYIYICT